MWYVFLVNAAICARRLYDRIYLDNAVVALVMPTIPPPLLPALGLYLCWELLHLRKVHRTPSCVICVIITMEKWQHLVKGMQMKVPFFLPLRSNKQRKDTDHVHVLPPVLEIWIPLLLDCNER